MQNISEDTYNRILKVLEGLRYAIFIAFWFLSLRLVLVYLSYTSSWLFALGCAAVIGTAVFTWWNTRWALFGFIACVPLVSGIQTIGFMRGAQLLGVVFALIYTSWFTKRVVFGKTIRPQNIIGNLVDILSGIVLLSLLFSLFSYPLNYTLVRFQSIAFQGANDPLWGIEAAYIILQGLFFFRMLNLEIGQDFELRNIVYIFYIHALIIIVFSMIHWILHIPDRFHYGNYGIFSPFNDSHSFGSYIVFLFFLSFTIIMAKTRKYRILNSTLVCMLLLLIVLSGSRATWVAFFLTGLAILFILLKRNHRILLISGVLAAIVLLNMFPAVFLNSDNKYLNRLGQTILVKRLSEDSAIDSRFVWWNRASNIISDYPITGSGVGSFYRISPLYNDPKNVKFIEKRENAHNYFLQLGSDLGIPALLIFIIIIFYTYKTGFQVLSQKENSGYIIKGILIGLSAYFITMLTSHPLILSNQQFLFWFVIASIAILHKFSDDGMVSKKLSRYSTFFVSILTVMVIGGHINNIYAGDKKGLPYEYGFYSYESVKEKNMRWTFRESGRRVTADSDIMGLVVYAEPYNIGSHGLKFDLFLNNRLLDQIHFTESGVKPRYYYFPGLKGKRIELKTTVNNTFNPYKLSMSKDPKKKRDQGVAVSPITFLKIMPKDGVGFYDRETSGDEKIPGWPQGQPVRYRQTGRRASINLQTEFYHGGTLKLKCFHPDIDQEPVKVKIMAGGTKIREETFFDNKWIMVPIEPDKISDSRALTFIVSRTWNPKLIGVSDDGRDLGVAVAYNPGH